MPSTAKGFPYPSGTVDKLADADLHIKALADFLNDNNGRIKSGSGVLDIITTNVVASVGIVFATAYPVGVTPIVLVCVSGSNGAGGRVYHTAAGNTGFTLNGINNNNANDIGYAWLAIG